LTRYPGIWRADITCRANVQGARPGESDGNRRYAGAASSREAVFELGTSGSFGHRTGKQLALADLVAGSEERLGVDLTVQILDRLCPARILLRAPYDPENRRLKM